MLGYFFMVLLFPQLVWKERYNHSIFSFLFKTSHQETLCFWHIQGSQGLHWSLSLDIIQERISNMKKNTTKATTTKGQRKKKKKQTGQHVSIL